MSQTKQIVSVHIPKAAGTSFRSNLADNYGEATITDIYSEADLALFNASTDTIKDSKILHGHFTPTQGMLDRFSNPFTVTWLRHPAKRVVSLYNYWRSLGLTDNPVQRDMLERNIDLETFATHPAIVNETTNYFAEIPLEKFDFVGITEEYEADVSQLAQILGWTCHKIYTNNVGPKSEPVSQDKLAALSTHLAPAMELYEKARSLRAERL